ncbi:DUF305 domain-containing protein [Streptomyces sp. YC504]|uniref:DUF305 domain-containing protein n=1 Tax=Streptomyces mesophilus TaxID=1775132 RepID=A0A6G4XNN8_9ACTN|nr:DUF305 domain-containing protein [Streptomyces mesophilus]NGO78231.1 DUF305 domain-containing protein [Streptomyces mesophilus]
MANRRRRGRNWTFTLAAGVLAATLTLGGCDSDGDSDSKSAAQDGASVIAPGKPGEKAEEISPEEAKKRGEDDTPNSADFEYAQMMIEHHRQAITMSELAPDRAKSDKVKRLAERIHAAQGPEISAMEAWIERNGGPRESAEHDAHHMPGMATEAQLKTLRASKGPGFDELFLKLMITHHGGAITMAQDVLSGGNNVQIEEMANDVGAQQTSEIERMRELL